MIVVILSASGLATNAVADSSSDSFAAEVSSEPKPEDCEGFRTALAARVAADKSAAPVVAPHDVNRAARRETARKCLKQQASSSFQIGVEGVAATLLQTAGQVVVERATSHAWTLLADQLAKAAGCGDNPRPFPRVCGVLGSIDLKDLVASPRVLLDAAIQDLLDQVRNALAQIAIPDIDVLGVKVSIPKIITGSFDAWRTGGQSAAFAYLRSELIELITHVASSLDESCTTPECKALRIVGSCMFNAGAQKKDVSRCALLDASGGYVPEQDGARRRAVVMERAVLEDDLTALIRVFTSSLSELVTTSKRCNEHQADCQALAEGLSQMLEGLADADWTRVAAGATSVMDAGGAVGLSIDSKHKRLFRLLASVGQYASTYTNKDQDLDTAADARKQAIASLIDATTDRSNRDLGVVVSVGGDFGVGWGFRQGIRADGPNVGVSPTPLHLALGVAVDSYGSTDCGFHGMLGIADLSQYVTFKDKDFTVADPDAKAALAFGATAGLRFALKSTPWFVGANFTYAPFVSDSGLGTKGSYQVLFLSAIYVPFFDFN